MGEFRFELVTGNRSRQLATGGQSDVSGFLADHHDQAVAFQGHADRGAMATAEATGNGSGGRKRKLHVGRSNAIATNSSGKFIPPFCYTKPVFRVTDTFRKKSFWKPTFVVKNAKDKVQNVATSF